MAQSELDQRNGSGELLQLAQVAAEYGFSEATLYGWRHRGVGPKSTRLGRRVYYRRRDIEGWIDAKGAAEAARRPS